MPEVAFICQELLCYVAASGLKRIEKVRDFVVTRLAGSLRHFEGGKDLAILGDRWIKPT